MASGVLVDVEVFINAGYGYDIRGEIVGEGGTVALADGRCRGGEAGRPPQLPAFPRTGGNGSAAPSTPELQDWLKAVAAGRPWSA